MDTIRLFLRTNSFRNSSPKNETNFIEKDNSSQLESSSGLTNNFFKKNQRSHSWPVQRNVSFPISLRRTKSFYYSNRIKKRHSTIKKFPTEITRHQVNYSTKSVSYPLTTNINNNQSVSKQIYLGKSNAFLTAASIFKYWVHLSRNYLLFLRD
jgi:hypothetical protein